MAIAGDHLSFHSIRFRAALLASVLVAVALIAVTAYTHVTLHRDLVQAGEGRATRVAAQLAAVLGSSIPARLEELQRIVDDDRVRRALVAPSPSAEVAAFERVRRVAGNTTLPQSIELWTSGGTRVAAWKIPEDRKSTR